MLKPDLAVHDALCIMNYEEPTLQGEHQEEASSSGAVAVPHSASLSSLSVTTRGRGFGQTGFVGPSLLFTDAAAHRAAPAGRPPPPPATQRFVGTSLLLQTSGSWPAPAPLHPATIQCNGWYT